MSKIVADNISPRGSDVTIAGVGTFNSTGVNLTGIVTASSGFVGNVTGTASTATASATAYGLSGSPTLSGITSVSTTNLTVNGNAYPATGPLSNRNLIINGAMQVAQRGTSQTNSTYGTVDRFFPSFSGGAVTTTQESLTSGDPYDEGFRNFARLTNTTSATGVSNYRLFVQRIEAQNVANSGWNYASATSYVTLSFWIRSSVSQAFIVRLRSEDGTLQNYPMSTGTLTADTWTKITKTIPGNSNVTINNDNGNGLRVEFAAFWGTNYTDSGVSLDTWAAYSASTRAPDMTSTWAGTTNATFDITGVQLEVGEVATPFEHRSYGQELALCQRYFVKIGSNYNGFRGTSSTSFQFYVPTPVEMRTTGSVQNYSSGSCRMYDSSGVTHASSSLSVNTVRGAMVELNGTGFSGVTDNASGWLNFTAELEAEL